MKISKNFPQFKNKTALFIVTGFHLAEMYKAKDGKIEKIGEFEVDYPKYSDRESFFERTGQGRVYGSGAVYEMEKDETRKRFLHELKKTEKSVISHLNITQIYIFSPVYIAHSVIETLPDTIRGKVKRVFIGNFTHEHPFNLLKKIKRQKNIEEKILPVKKEARDILNRFKGREKKKK